MNFKLSAQQRYRFLTAVAFSAVLAGCSAVVPVDDCRSESLAVDQMSFTLRHADGRPSKLSMWYPSNTGTYQRVLFFHGSRLPPERYNRLLTDLASTGLIIISPMHIDSETIEYEKPPGIGEIWTTRKQDALALLDPQVGSDELPDGVRVSDQAVIVAGHSFGAFTAQALVGALAIGDEPLSHKFPIAAVVALSPPGPLPNFIGEQAWDRLRIAQLVTTGTADVTPGFSDDWKLHAASHHRALAGDQWLWVGNDVDHYFGRIMGRLDRPQSPQVAQYKDLLLTITSFLHQYVPMATEQCARPLVQGQSKVATISRR